MEAKKINSLEEIEDIEFREYLRYFRASEDEKLKIDFIDYLTKVNPENDDLRIKIEVFDWKLFLKEFNKEYDELWKNLELPDFITITGKRLFLQRAIKKDIAIRLLFEFIFQKNRKEEKIFFNQIRKRIVSIMLTYKQLGNLFKMDKFSSDKMNEKILIMGKKFSGGKAISERNQKAYQMILEKNEKYYNENGKNNYRRSAFIVARQMGTTKDHIEEFEQLYKSFLKFNRKSKT